MPTCRINIVHVFAVHELKPKKKKTTSEASNSVKEWLTDLRALVYDVEDVFDELNYEALRRKFTVESQVARCSSKMRALIPSCCSTFSLSNVKFGAKLKDITTRFDQIVKKEKNLGLTKNSYVKLEKRKPTTSCVDKSRYLTSEPCPSENIALLQEKLKEKLSLKKFLIVIDDVCNGNFDDWETLCLPFKTGVAGCKILVTTRNKFVMTTMNVTPHHLDQLSIEDCVLILQYYALGGFAMLKKVQAGRSSPRHLEYKFEGCCYEEEFQKNSNVVSDTRIASFLLGIPIEVVTQLGNPSLIVSRTRSEFVFRLRR
ncbi:hypothetical protein ACFE04_010308 [Oxalis oulophora]